MLTLGYVTAPVPGGLHAAATAFLGTVGRGVGGWGVVEVGYGVVGVRKNMAHDLSHLLKCK